MTGTFFGAFVVCGLLIISGEAQRGFNGENDENKLQNNFQEGIRFDDFDLQLCQALYSASPVSNVAVSPVSVKLVLAMLYEAARGETAAELQRTLNLPVNKKDARVKFGAIHKSLSAKTNDTELKIASRIFIPPSAVSSSGYQRVLQKYFSASIQMVNFSKPKEAAKKINDWVCNATNGKISSMLDPNDPEIPNLSLILSNALFFKGNWEIPFDPESTKEGNFYLRNNNTIKTQMMESRDTYFVAENEESGYTILRLPYHGNKYSLYIILPKARDGIENIVQKLTPDEIRNTMKQMEPSMVNLVLPKFSFQFAVDLEPILIKLGIKKTFDPAEADFPLISNSSGVHVSRILHKAGLEVNELGSTVYGATTITMPERFRPPGEEFFLKVDHPFVFFIKDDTAETIVFAAKVENPRTMAPATSNLTQSTPDPQSLPKQGSNEPQYLPKPGPHVPNSTPRTWLNNRESNFSTGGNSQFVPNSGSNVSQFVPRQGSNNNQSNTKTGSNEPQYLPNLSGSNIPNSTPRSWSNNRESNNSNTGNSQFGPDSGSNFSQFVPRQSLNNNQSNINTGSNEPQYVTKPSGSHVPISSTPRTWSNNRESNSSTGIPQFVPNSGSNVSQFVPRQGSNNNQSNINTGSNFPFSWSNVLQSTPKTWTNARDSNPELIFPQTTPPLDQSNSVTPSNPELGNRIQTFRPPYQVIQKIPPRYIQNKPRIQRHYPNQFPVHQFSGGFPTNQFPSGGQFPGGQFPGGQFPEFPNINFPSFPNPSQFPYYPPQGQDHHHHHGFKNFVTKKIYLLKHLFGHKHGRWQSTISPISMSNTSPISMSTPPNTTPLITTTITEDPEANLIEIFGTPPTEAVGPESLTQIGRSNSEIRQTQNSTQNRVDNLFFNLIGGNNRT